MHPPLFEVIQLGSEHIPFSNTNLGLRHDVHFPFSTLWSLQSSETLEHLFPSG